MKENKELLKKRENKKKAAYFLNKELKNCLSDPYWSSVWNKWKQSVGRLFLTKYGKRFKKSEIRWAGAVACEGKLKVKFISGQGERFKTQNELYKPIFVKTNRRTEKGSLSFFIEFELTPEQIEKAAQYCDRIKEVEEHVLFVSSPEYGSSYSGTLNIRRNTNLNGFEIHLKNGEKKSFYIRLYKGKPSYRLADGAETRWFDSVEKLLEQVEPSVILEHERKAKKLFDAILYDQIADSEYTQVNSGYVVRESKSSELHGLSVPSDARGIFILEVYGYKDPWLVQITQEGSLAVRSYNNTEGEWESYEDFDALEEAIIRPMDQYRPKKVQSYSERVNSSVKMSKNSENKYYICFSQSKKTQYVVVTKYFNAYLWFDVNGKYTIEVNQALGGKETKVEADTLEEALDAMFEAFKEKAILLKEEKQKLQEQPLTSKRNDSQSLGENSDQEEPQKVSSFWSSIKSFGGWIWSGIKQIWDKAILRQKSLKQPSVERRDAPFVVDNKNDSRSSRSPGYQDPRNGEGKPENPQVGRKGEPKDNRPKNK